MEHPFEGGHGKPLKFGGHCYYTRKCITGECDGDFWDRSIGGIKIPEVIADYTLYVTVLAKGPRVGKRCNLGHKKRYARPFWLPDVVRVGDVLMCPPEDAGIQYENHRNRSVAFLGNRRERS